MVNKTRGIVLHQFRYSDSSVIVHVYTEHFGRQSFIINGSRNRKTKGRIKLSQPLSIIDMEVYIKSSREIHRVKEISIHIPYLQIPYHPVKNAIALFIAEILYKTLREEETNTSLFEFLTNSFQVLDISEQGFANFHPVFLMNLSKHLGFYPLNNFSEEKSIFDMKNGKFVEADPGHPATLKPPHSRHIATLQTLNYDNMSSLSLNGSQRNRLLEILIDYFRIHIESMGEVKSIKVLHSVFS